MLDALIHFPQMQAAGYGKTGRAVLALCERHRVPVLKLNERQYALRQRDYEVLMSRMQESVK
jgi:hypothetical protein